MKTGLFEIISETVMLKIAPILEKGEAIFCCKSSEEGWEFLVIFSHCDVR